MTAKTIPAISSFRPPVVAVLGHVDHGKTTLLDFIRKTHVADAETGGITQKIGAYQVKVHPTGSLSAKKADRDDFGDKVTFIDTPGHEAFIKMRARGATVADIAILVVAADDSVKPQTKESIKIIKEAKIPMIVAVNKIDLPGANIEKVKQDLARAEVQVEGFGGEIPIVQISAKTGKGVDELLEKILSVASGLKLPNEPKKPLEAVVLETHVDKGKGMTATVIVKAGTLTPKTPLFEESKEAAKVRALFDEHAKPLTEAVPGMPAEVLGFFMLPAIGSILRDTPIHQAPQIQQAAVPAVPTVDFLSLVPEGKTLNIILKADSAGSLEAILASLGKGAVIVGSGIGDITEADILLAKSTHAFVIGFNAVCKGSVAKLAETERVVVRTYSLIYELLEELTEALSGIQEVLTKERELGKGTVIAEFPFDGKRIAGTKVTDGRLAKGDQVKVMREESEVGKARIKSIRRGKDEITKAETGTECGVLLDPQVDFALGDAIIPFTRS